MNPPPAETDRLVSPGDFAHCLRWGLSRCEPTRAATILRQLAVAHSQQRPIVTAAVTRGDQWRAVAIAIPQPAAAATLILLADQPLPADESPPTADSESASGGALARVLRTLSQELRLLGVTFLQANAETPEQAHRLRSVGFRHIADLALMSLEAEDFAAALHTSAVASRTVAARRIDPRCEWLSLEQPGGELHPTFAPLLAETFVQTLDCPALADFRTPEEIARGYLESPTLDHAGSRLLRVDGDWAAVLVLSRHQLNAPQLGGFGDQGRVTAGSAAGFLELSYMGVTCRWRGAGLGIRLVSAAVSQAQRSQVARIVLAADLENGPAVGIYRRLGWQECLREGVWGRRL
jgi:ribosomal protein S18 acetylase RimI-like enzyme